MKDTKILHSAAWHEHAETEINSKHWGSNEEAGLLPYQVAYSEKIGGWTPFMEGLPLDKIIRSSEEAKLAQFERQCFYFPNTVETVKERGKYEERESGRRVAVYRWIVSDIDCKTESERVAAVNRILEFPIPYSMLVSSGNGFHVYWALAPIHMVDLDEQTRTKIEERYDRLIKSFCARLGGDTTKASYLCHAMRVPMTWNLKNVSEPQLCKVLDQNSHVYSLPKLERLARRNELFIKKKAGRKKRPRRPSLTYVAKVIKDHMRITGQTSFPKHYRRYLEFLLWYKCWPYFVEGTANRKNVLGQDGVRISQARKYFLSHGYIVVVQQGNRFRNLATRYSLTGKFFDDFGYEKKEGRSREQLNAVFQRIGGTDVKASERRAFQINAYRDLRNAGLDHEGTVDLILDVLSKRSCGPRHSEAEVRKDLSFIKERFILLKQKYGFKSA